MQKKKKILFVLEHFYPYIGGAEKLFYVLTKALATEGFEVVVVTTRFNKSLSKREVHNGVKIIRVDCWNRFAFTFFSLLKIFQQGKDAEVFHTTTYNAALPAVIVGRILNKPVYVTFHEVWGALWKTLPFTTTIQKYGFYFFEKLLLKLPFEKFIAVSDFTKKELIKNGIVEEKIVRIYNGLDYKKIEHYIPSPPGNFTFTYFGRLGISKGLDILIPSVAKFVEKYPNVVFKMIIPKEPRNLYKKIMQLVNDYNLESTIDFKHNLPREELYKELLNSTCVVVPSYSEGFCFAAAETVALKIPIVSSHKGALPEVVSGKYIVMEKMEMQSLTNSLIAAYEKKWQEKPIKYFRLKETVNNYLKLYGIKAKANNS